MTKVSLAALFVGAVLMQLVLPLQASQTGQIFPEVRYLVVPYSIAAVATFVAVQVAIVGVWLVVSTIPRGEFFTRRSSRLIDLVRVAVAASAAIPAGTAFHVLFFVGLGGPGVVLGLAAACVGGTALVLLLTVAKRVYVQARVEHDELEAVV